MMEPEFFQLGGGVVRIDWGDEALRRVLGAAVSHRRVAAREARLTIRVRTGEYDWPVSPEPGLLVSSDASGLRMIDRERRLSHWIDPTATRAELICDAPEKLPAYERAAPFRFILQRWLDTLGVNMVHAGAVGLPGKGAVLLAARSGGGKSTTTLACLNSPLHLLGEDFLAVNLAGVPRVWSLYNTAKLKPAGLAQFPELLSDEEGVLDETSGKTVVNLARRHAGRLADGLPLRAILVLKIVGGPESRIRPAAPGEAVKEMLTSLLMVLPDTRRSLFEFVTRLVQARPVFRLELGTNPQQTAALVHDFVANLEP